MIINWIDWVVLAIVGLSTLAGLWRGFFREAIALAGWIAAAFLTLRYAVAFGAALPFTLPWPALKTVLAGLAIVVACVLAATLVGTLVRKLLVAAQLSTADRVLGGLFGAARGALVVFLVVFFAEGSRFTQYPDWRASLTLRGAESAVHWLAPHLGSSLAQGSSARS